MQFRKLGCSFKYFKFVRQFSSSSYNPYYVLGVEKDMSFDEIKKQYYKLAAEYHPDINKSPEAGKQFVQIKEAFETIKKWQGKAVRMDFEGSSARNRSDFNSVRPNASQYSDEFDADEEYAREEADYKEWAYKASQDAEHMKFSDSFETINDIKDIKFRPDNVDVPDASKRFKLDENKAKLLKFSDNSGFFMIAVVGCLLLVFNWANKFENQVRDEQMENITYNLKNKEDYDQLSIDKNENTMKAISTNMRQHKDYIEFTGKIEGSKASEKALRNKFAPQPQTFVTFDSN